MDLKTDVPIVLVSGFLGPSNAGWGEAYWGEATKLGTKYGKVIVAPVSCMGSAYDRACEIFAFLKGLRVDFGEEHSKRCGHNRYGKSFEGKGEHTKWSEVNPVHLIGHSFGGNTIRVLSFLLATDHFKCGSSAKWIKSLSTISSPLQGSLLTYYLGACEDHEADKPVHMFSPGYLIGVTAHLYEIVAQKTSLVEYLDIGLGHWDLPNGGLKLWLNSLCGGENGGGTPAVCQRDNAANDMTIAAAKRWNDLISENVDPNEYHEFHFVASNSTSTFSISDTLKKHFRFGDKYRLNNREVKLKQESFQSSLQRKFRPFLLCARDFFVQFGATKSVNSSSFEILRGKLCPHQVGLERHLKEENDGLCSAFSQHISNPNEEQQETFMMSLEQLIDSVDKLPRGRHSIKLPDHNHFSIVPLPDESSIQREFFSSLFRVLTSLPCDHQSNPNSPE